MDKAQDVQRAIAVRHSGGLSTSPSLDLRPRTIEDAERIAVNLVGSKLLPPELQDRGSLFLLLLQGADLGLSVAQAIRGLSIIKGKPVMNADLMAALCTGNTSVCERFECVEATHEKVTYETKRVGREPRRVSFSMEDAKQAQLLGRGADSNWAKYPVDMMHARAKARLAKQVYPDLLFGVISQEEREDEMAIEMQEQAPKVYAAPSPPAPAKEKPPTIEVQATVVKPRTTKEWSDRIGTCRNLDELEALKPELRLVQEKEMRKTLIFAYQAMEALLTNPREPGEEG